MKWYKYYLVDDIIIKVLGDKDMQGYREVPRELVEGMKPCEVLAELWKKAKEREQHDVRRGA